MSKRTTNINKAIVIILILVMLLSSTMSTISGHIQSGSSSTYEESEAIYEPMDKANGTPTFTSLTLLVSPDLANWSDLPGDFDSGFEMPLDTNVTYFYLDVNESSTTDVPLAAGYYGFYVAEHPDWYFDYWAIRGVTASASAGTWQAHMWTIINGVNPIFYLSVDANQSYDLIDGLQYDFAALNEPLRINGDYHGGDYVFTGTINDTGGVVSDPLNMSMMFFDPSIPAFSDVQATPTIQKLNNSVNISCILTDDVSISSATVYIDGPGAYGSTTNAMNSGTGDLYYFTAPYTILGNYTFYIQATDSEANTNLSQIEEFSIVTNVPPTANFSYSPEFPKVGEITYFTSNSIDVDGTISAYHWDFGDTYTADVANPVHVFTAGGIFNVTLTVTDNNGANDTFVMTLDVRANYPPLEPFNPHPTNGSVDIDVNADLFWNASDPDEDNLTFDVYLGLTATPANVASNLSNATYDPGTLALEETYYWRVVVWDTEGQFTIGPLWTFNTTETGNQPPFIPYDPTPDNHETNISGNINLSWFGGDPDGDSVTYDVYFGTDPSPSITAIELDTPSFNPGPLSGSTTYYWRVVSWDEHGVSAQGSVWDFTTGTAGNLPPTTPVVPSGPEYGRISTIYTYTTVADDPNDDLLHYQWSWDGVLSDWLGPYEAGDFVTADHAWDTLATHEVRVRVKDVAEEISDWSPIFQTTVINALTISNIGPGDVIIGGMYAHFMFMELSGRAVYMGLGDLRIDAQVTSDVDSVKFLATRRNMPTWQYEYWDYDTSDDVYCYYHLPMGVYEISVVAYDMDGYEIGRVTVPSLRYVNFLSLSGN